MLKSLRLRQALRFLDEHHLISVRTIDEKEVVVLGSARHLSRGHHRPVNLSKHLDPSPEQYQYQLYRQE